MTCFHNQRCRYTHGFYCEECHQFFPLDSPTYRSGEMLENIGLVLWNLNVKQYREGLPPFDDCKAFLAKMDANRIEGEYRYRDPEILIAEAEAIMKSHGATAKDATLTIG
jgi:hypothetical protein